jgi:hypothetical protein
MGKGNIFTVHKKLMEQHVQNVRACVSYKELNELQRKYAEHIKKIKLSKNELNPEELGEIGDLELQIEQATTEKIELFGDSPSEKTGNVEEETKSEDANLRKKQIKPVFDKLKEIKILQASLKERGAFGSLNDLLNYTRAAQATEEIYSKIKELSKNYVSDGDLDSYQTESAKIFDEESHEMKELSKHRGGLLSKELWVNIALFIAGLGVFYGIACAIQGGFFKVQTNSVKRIRELENTLDEVTYVPSVF